MFTGQDVFKCSACIPQHCKWLDKGPHALSLIQVLEVDIVDAADITPDAFWQRYAVRPCCAHVQYCRTAT